MIFSLKNVKRLSNKRALPYLNFNLKTSNFARCFKMNPSIKLSLSNYKLFLTTRPSSQSTAAPRHAVSILPFPSLYLCLANRRAAPPRRRHRVGRTGPRRCGVLRCDMGSDHRPWGARLRQRGARSRPNCSRCQRTWGARDEARQAPRQPAW